MKKIVYFILIFFYSSFALAGLFTREIYIDCTPSNIFLTNDPKNLMLRITNSKWCVYDVMREDIGEIGRSGERCGDVSIFNSKIVRTKNLVNGNSTTAKYYNEDVYWKLNRNNSTVAVYSAKTNEILSPVHTCKKRRKI